MSHRIKMICVINPDKFKWENVIKEHYLSGLLDSDLYDITPGLAEPTVPRNAHEEFCRVIDNLKILDLSYEDDRDTFCRIIEEHLGDLQFLLQDGNLYGFGELYEMGEKGIVRITGGGKRIILVDYQTIKELPAQTVH